MSNTDTLPAESRSVARAEAPNVPKPITVLFLDHTAALSGGEIALLRLLEALDRELVQPIVLLGTPGPLEPRLEALGVQTVVLPLGANVREVRKDTLGFGALAKLGALIATVGYGIRVAWFARRCGARIIHANSLKSDIYGGLAGLLAGVPVIWHVRDHINAGYLPRAAVAAFRLLAKYVPAFVVTNSQSTLRELRLDRERRTAVVPSGLRIRSEVVHDGLATADEGSDSVEEKEPAPRPWSSPVRIGLVGRIARWKGQHILIEAAAQILAAGGDAEFRIVGAPLFGEEEYEAQLRAQVAAAGLEDRVRFLGFQANVQEVYRQLDIVVHASIAAEPFGQVVIEGMAEGLPVVATNGGGVREIIIHGKNGLLVPMGDATAMAEALQSLLGHPAEARRLGAAGYRWVRRHFTAAQSARKIERVYRTLVARGAAGVLLALFSSFSF